MATLKGLYRCIDACNGEIRIMAARYDSGWYCLIVLQEQSNDLAFEKFEDLVGGDNDYFDAIEFFKAIDSDITLSIGATPMHALELSIDAASSKLEGYED